MESQSLKVFKCPSCGGPLEPDKYSTTTKCPYCGAAVINPVSSTPTGTLSDVTRLAKEGKLDEAARIYSKITGLSHENAMFSVKSMAGVREEEPASSNASPYSNPYGMPQASPSYQAPPVPQPVYQPKVRARGGSCLSGIIRLIVLLSILGSAFPAIWKALQFQLPFELPFSTDGITIIPEPFAKEVMSINTGSFKDPRAIQVDGNDNILLFNYNSSDIQMFDPQGNELSVMKITDADGDEINNSKMGVTSNGTIYVPGFQSIMSFSESGERLREIPNTDQFFIIHTLLVGADDKLYVRSSSGILRFDENNKVDLFIPDATLEDLSGQTPSIGALGVDAQGNIYFSGTFNKDVLKFSPTGEFISSFGGDEFTSVRAIEIDSYGRIYIVDFSEVRVYDSNFTYLGSIDGAFWGVDFDSQGYMYAVETNGDDVLKFEVKKPDAQ
ncbi:MAG TPA: hypothetical protein PLL95_07435 [Anaerolineales bacterium]|nr:hypothetical protein [Anaerolineales bacterium]